MNIKTSNHPVVKSGAQKRQRSNDTTDKTSCPDSFQIEPWMMVRMNISPLFFFIHNIDTSSNHHLSQRIDIICFISKCNDGV